MRILLLIVLIPLVAGAQAPSDDSLAQVPVKSWQIELLSERAAVDSYYTHDPLSPFNAIGQRTLKPAQPLRVVLAADTLLLGHPTADPGLPQLEFLWQKSNGTVNVRAPNAGGQFKLNRTPIGPVPQTVTSSDIIFAEEFPIKAYSSERSARVRAFRPVDEFGAANYKGISWFEPDQTYRINANVEPANRDTVTMPTSAGLEKHYIRHSKLRFELNGEIHELTLFAPANDPDEYGFLPFTDATSGELTYGGGRYMDVELPISGQETLLLDFNTAYNPYCAYTPHYNCPIPPKENDLSVPVKAGEKAYK